MKNLIDLKNLIIIKMLSANNIVVVPHSYADVDAIASAYGVYVLFKKLGKKPYILFNDKLKDIHSSTRFLLNNIKNDALLINLKEYSRIKNSNDLIVIVDINSRDLICLEYPNIDNTILIDHHKINSNTINTNNKYIDINASSTSEIISNLFNVFNIKIPYDLANYLFAGIYLDTIKFQNIYNRNTFITLSDLMNDGANIKNINKYFYSDFKSDRKIQELVSKAEFITKNIALSIADPSILYTRTELAMVADYLLKFKIDASFAAGFIDNDLISISARSNGQMDVCSIMENFNGGGSTYRAAAKINSYNIKDIEKTLKKIIKK